MATTRSLEERGADALRRRDARIEWYSTHSDAAEALKSDRVLYDMRTSPFYGGDQSDMEALATFVRRIEEISMPEVSEWRSDLSRPASSGS